jgi:uncharacterized membrane protein YkvA (DUF1232 family)
MRIFISHSWRDKTIADQLAGDLRTMGEVWQDIEQLRPGDPIQPTIDAALAEMDLVVVLWSAHAAASERGVLPEIRKSLELDRTIIPCSLDDFPLPKELEGMLAVDFHDYSLGFGRLCIAIMAKLGGDLGVDMQDEMDAIRDVKSALKYVSDYRNRQGIAGSDRDHWIGRMVTAMNAMTERLTRLQDRLANAGDFIQQVYHKLHAAGEDRAQVQAVLQEVIRNEHIAPDLMPQVRGHIEQYLRTLPEPKPTRPASTEAPMDGGSVARGFGGSGGSAEQEIEARLRGHVAAPMLPTVAALIHYYITAASESLDTLAAATGGGRSAAAAQVVHFLATYLQEPNDLMPQSEFGVWGYLDDAWLIHNTAYRFVEAGLLPAATFHVDWQRIASADPIVVACLPPMVRLELENYLQQSLGLIAAEVNAYMPQFTHGGGNYHPQMGQAQAVGGVTSEARRMYQSAQIAGTQKVLDGWSASIDADWSASQGGYSY